MNQKTNQKQLPAKTKETKAPTAEGADTENKETPKKVRGIVLPSGEKRVDYIRKAYYEEGKTRGEIARALSEITGSVVPYQIVFASTKKTSDADVARKAEKEKVKAEEVAAKAKADAEKKAADEKAAAETKATETK